MSSQRAERYALAMAGSDDVIWDWDLRSGRIYLSPRWKALLGLRADDVSRRVETWFHRVHADDRHGLHAALDAHLQGRAPRLRHEHRIRHENGTYRWVLCRGRAVLSQTRSPVRIAGTFTDITEWATAEEHLRYAASHDPLTGLPNRAELVRHVRETLDGLARDSERQHALLFVDIDDFKAINDRLGHVAGDQVLAAVARRLGAAVRAGDVLTRYGGDEFAALLRDLDDASHALRIVERMHASLRDPFMVDGQRLAVTCSIGLAHCRVGEAHVDRLVAEADKAMYTVKARHRRSPGRDDAHRLRRS
jgi:diguanylate cyclase (GGDEF)-like protein/PAS domain S-box-containing protein